MNRENLKQALISIVIGATVTLFATIFQELANYLKSHSTEIISGVSAAGLYLAKAYKG